MDSTNKEISIQSNSESIVLSLIIKARNEDPPRSDN
jgi:hypothetical protein